MGARSCASLSRRASPSFVARPGTGHCRVKQQDRAMYGAVNAPREARVGIRRATGDPSEISRRWCRCVCVAWSPYWSIFMLATLHA